MNQQQIDKLVEFDGEGYTILLCDEHVYLEEDDEGNIIYYTEPWDKNLLSELDEGFIEVFKPVGNWWV